MVSLQFFRTADGKSDYKIIDLQGTLHVLRQPSPWSFTADWGERVKDANPHDPVACKQMRATHPWKQRSLVPPFA